MRSPSTCWPGNMELFPDSKIHVAHMATWPTWGPPGSCRPHVHPTLAPWTLLLRGLSRLANRGRRDDCLPKSYGHVKNVSITISKKKTNLFWQYCFLKWFYLYRHRQTYVRAQLVHNHFRLFNLLINGCGGSFVYVVAQVEYHVNWQMDWCFWFMNLISFFLCNLLCYRNTLSWKTGSFQVIGIARSCKILLQKCNRIVYHM